MNPSHSEAGMSDKNSCYVEALLLSENVVILPVHAYLHNTPHVMSHGTCAHFWGAGYLNAAEWWWIWGYQLFCPMPCFNASFQGGKGIHATPQAMPRSHVLLDPVTEVLRLLSPFLEQMGLCKCMLAQKVPHAMAIMRQSAP